MPDIKIIKCENRQSYAHCVQIRFEVFVIGQNVPTDREVDEYENEAVYYCAYIDGAPAGTVRYRVKDGAAKLERLAVLDRHQGHGLGRALTEHLINDVQKTTNLKTIKLSSQTHAIPFYERLGFKATGEEYDDAGIPHRDMYLAL